MKKKFAICAILAVFACLVAIWHFGFSEKPSGNVTFGVIDSVGTVGSDSQDAVDNAVAENMFQIFINTDITLDSDEMADLLVQNTARNHYACYIELVDEDGGSFYKSEVIEPGYKLERDAVSGISAGRHACVAYFHILDDAGQEINQIGANVFVTKQ